MRFPATCVPATTSFLWAVSAFLLPAGAQSTRPSAGLTFVDPMSLATASLVDSNSRTVHTWTTSARGIASYLDRKGNVLRVVKNSFSFGGTVERLALDGTRLWKYSPPFGNQHHDIHELPNGNILMAVTHDVSKASAIALGRDPKTVPEIVSAERIIEVKPTGPTTGSIVWEWRVMDHLVQDFDSKKPNFGPVAQHPQRIDVNYPRSIGGLWQHLNGIDYNPQLDQVVLSCRNWSECWVIDHSTTTTQARGTTGGKSGKGGDLLYRWGNPAAYKTAGTQQLHSQHDVNWIWPGYPGAGNLICFNNKRGLLLKLGDASAVTEFAPPIDHNGNYSRAVGKAFGPAAPAWEYLAAKPTDFYSAVVSSAVRLVNGNTLVCSGTQDHVFELGASNKIVWQATVPMPFKARRYERTLWASDEKVSATSGGRIDFDLMAGTAWANQVYIMLGSASGTKPGINVGPFTIPLNLDVYLLSSLQSPLLPKSIGKLDATGNAQAGFVLPASIGLPFLGLTLNHAHVLLDSGLALRRASNAVPVTIVK